MRLNTLIIKVYVNTVIVKLHPFFLVTKLAKLKKWTKQVVSYKKPNFSEPEKALCSVRRNQGSALSKITDFYVRIDFNIKKGAASLKKKKNSVTKACLSVFLLCVAVIGFISIRG